MIAQICSPSMFLENPYRLLVPGQWVRSHNGLVWHHGIITGFGWDFTTNTRVVLVTHNRPQIGVAETTLQEFSSNWIEIYHDVESNEHGRWSATIAKANINKGYDPAFQNCEHFASFCFYGGEKSESQQVQALVAVALGVGLTAWAMNSRRTN
jgi:hypothetical protein